MKVKFCFNTNTVHFLDSPITSSSDGVIKISASASIFNLPHGCSTSEEAIIHYYEQYGEKCVDHLRGPFSFILNDTQNGIIIAARDRIGERRLYYTQTLSGISFSNSVKELLQEEVKYPQINIQHLLEPIRFTGPVDLLNTWVEQIKRVLPGQMLIIDKTGLHSRQYWQLQHSDSFTGSKEEAKKDLLNLMEESVNLCMQGNESIAITLSGGIDSSCVAAMAKRTGHEVYSVTTGYSGSYACDERDVARRFARENGFHHLELEFNEQDYLDAFDEMSAIIDEPITDSTAIAQWAMFKKVKKAGFNILLGGMGGDELFFGYPAWNKLAESLQKRRYFESLFPWNSIQKKKDYIKFVTKNLKYIMYAGYPSKIEDKSYGWWIHDDYYRFVNNASLKIDDEIIPLQDFLIYKDFPPCKPGKELYSIYDDCFKKVMTGAYLFIDDCLGEAIGIENRSPLIDYKLVEYVMNLPLGIKYTSGKPKQFMKYILDGIVPDYILYANKRGFTSPSTYIDKVSKKYNYKYFITNDGFYNSALCDAMLKHCL